MLVVLLRAVNYGLPFPTMKFFVINKSDGDLSSENAAQDKQIEKIRTAI